MPRKNDESDLDVPTWLQGEKLKKKERKLFCMTDPLSTETVESVIVTIMAILLDPLLVMLKNWKKID